MHLPRAFAFLAACFIAASPSLAETVKGNGVLKSEVRAATGFTGVGVSLPAKVEVRLGAVESVTVEADENLLPLIETSVRNGSLQIKPVRRNLSIESRAIRVLVQARQIEQLDIGGSGSILAETLRGPRLKLAIGGSGSMDLRGIETDRVDVSVGGSGDVKLAGTVRRFEASIAGSGEVEGPGLLADEAQITIAGSGAAQLGIRKLLDVTVAGSGAVRYFGDPVVKRTILGSGVIRRMGPLPQ